MQQLVSMLSVATIALVMTLPAQARCYFENGRKICRDGGSVEVKNNKVKVQGGGGGSVKVKGGSSGSVKVEGPGGRGGKVSW
ncbi:MAG: hypothetical protein DBW85_03110 [Synechococcus sp. MED-G71]|jgi:hypothetical protein|nr:MAG: hypothetical protein DBW85_03110 [Synechococcus sp. MED-G71]|tara:strand:- start:6276 stop:6521 length:246 start_codon:yes stop_codon:yes gene_type:complete